MPLAIVLKSKQGFKDLVLDSRYADESAAKRGMNKLAQGPTPSFHTRHIIEVVDTKHGPRVVREL